MSNHPGATTPKQRMIYDSVRQRIEEGDFQPGDRIPSDSQLVTEFGVSRPTVAKALQELEKSGWVKRRAGSGTFVLKVKRKTKHLGLLIFVRGETEIFGPICGEIAGMAQENGHSLLWGSSSSGSLLSPNKITDKGDAAWELCQSYIRDRVAGVFFAPLEFADEQDQINRRIMEAFGKANIPVVLLDRDYLPYPDRSPHDFVGVDNRRVGSTVTQHLIDSGCKRILFLARPGSANSVDARIAGYRETVALAGSEALNAVCRGEPDDTEYIHQIVKKHRPDGIVCGNDITAGHLLHTLDAIGVVVPEEVKVAGIDDVKYAKLLRVPLTSIHQPCASIGKAAYYAMLQRLENPDEPARDVLLACDLVVRETTRKRNSNGTTNHSTPQSE